ncbi:Anoctamin-6-like [Scleropages formosus]|uniref:Anoctamin n=1 Tax=Scleropages formosus TaxID=113540 RepID=A0A0P7WBS1_SCLFO|nr:Anoctamin-6-like [Scleropages formosus]
MSADGDAEVMMGSLADEEDTAGDEVEFEDQQVPMETFVGVSGELLPTFSAAEHDAMPPVEMSTPKAVRAGCAVTGGEIEIMFRMYSIMREEHDGDDVSSSPISHFSPQTEFNNQPDSLFFNDGQRRIDFVLVYEDEDKKEFEKRYTFQRRKRRREFFEADLMVRGLELEASRSVSVFPFVYTRSPPSRSRSRRRREASRVSLVPHAQVLDDKVVFVKVHMPWDVLCTYAEVLHIKLPIQPNDLSQSSSPFGWLTKLCEPSKDVIQPEVDYFTAPFEKDRIDSFCVKDRAQFFAPDMRSRMAYYVLSRAYYEVRGDVKKFGINKLLDGGVYKAAFPLHDVSTSRRPSLPFNVKSTDVQCANERYRLYQEWAHPKNFYKTQPLDLIRKYYGEKIGIYFAWLGFYTYMLAGAAIVGLGCFIYGYQTQHTSTWSKEVCDPLIGGRIVMCPQCDKECTYWMLNSTCDSSKKLCIFDNFGTLVFAVFMSIWVTLFLEFWKRYQAELEYEWDTVQFLEQEEQPRPEYEAKCCHERINPITKEKEKVPYTSCEKCLRVSCGAGTVLFWVALIIASIVGIIVYRLAAFFTFSSNLRKELKELKELQPIKEYVTPQMATSVTASVISFVVIMVLNILYERVAIWITDFELPRTRTEYENSLTLKMFLFQFVNYYSSCFYIAFFKGKLVGFPGKPVYWLGTYRNEECDPGGCLIELTTQLTVIMGGKAIWNNIQEVLFPWVKNLISRCCKRVRSEKVIPRWEQDFQLQAYGALGLFYEYLEMVIQFGFVTLFVASFPLAPLLAFLNNVVEIRVDAWKITTQFRRMVPEKAQDIGAWQPILQAVAILAVATNAMITAFTSDMIPRLVYYWSFSVFPYGDHPNHTMEGYINGSLSVFDIHNFSTESEPLTKPYWFQNITTCRYRDFRYPPGHPWEYQHNIYYWHVIAAKLAFIIVLEHVVYLTKFILCYMIPDVPLAVKEKIKREKYLTQVILHEANLKLVSKHLKPIVNILKEHEDKDSEIDLPF